MESARHSPPTDIPHLILCEVPNENDLLEAAQHIKPHITIYLFYEPDLNNQLTAIATEPITGIQRQYFRKFKLLNLKGEKHDRNPRIPQESARLSPM